MASKKPVNPWTAEDEQEHYPCIIEWWCPIAFFRTLEDKKSWSLKASFAQWIEPTKIPGLIYNMTVFDETKSLQWSKAKPSFSL